ncbi:MAG: DUF2971 domain-containing protein [Silicimonas sp.]|uniref:DUF2971 domain-containing protein n=1 Tax=Alphaproteobacteria TaxID=28211 RepID=UPI0032ECBC26
MGALGKTKRLYHFTSAGYALSNIKHRRLKIAQIADLNDPFDLRAPRLSSRQERAIWDKWRSDMSATLGMLCFCPHWRNVVMWSHYADKHKGVCLGFDIPESKVNQVEYTQNRPGIDLSHLPTVTDMQRFASLKSTDWQYEDEWRVWSRLDQPCEVEGRQLYFHEFDDELRLAEIIVGPLCKVTSSDLHPLVSGYEQQPKLIKARLAFKSFRVTSQRLGLE